jgi:hypothetical protein
MTVIYRHAQRDSTRWEGFRFRPGDIVISVPAKCGTTWLQMICALLVFQTPDLPAPLARISPWLDRVTRPLAEVLADLDAQQHRRFIKTHTPLDGLPFDPAVTYLCVGRDPRDVAISFDNHLQNMKRNAVGDPLRRMRRPPTAIARFWAWADDPAPPNETVSSLRLTLHHLDSFWQRRHEPNVIVLHYEDLSADLGIQMRALAGRLGITVTAAWPELVRAATLDRMRARASLLAPEVGQGFWRDDARFFHRGTSGQWRDLLGPADLVRYHARVTQLADAGLAAWTHSKPWPPGPG